MNDLLVGMADLGRVGWQVGAPGHDPGWLVPLLVGLTLYLGFWWLAGVVLAIWRGEVEVTVPDWAADLWTGWKSARASSRREAAPWRTGR